MIDFHFKSDFIIEDKTNYIDWINRIISSEGFDLGHIDYIFCSDDYLLGLNLEYLNHDTLTDIITFDYTYGKNISGDIFISTDRVAENAESFAVGFSNELLRVMSHGLLHLMGYGDKTEKESAIMRQKEEEKMQLCDVEP